MTDNPTLPNTPESEAEQLLLAFLKECRFGETDSKTQQWASRSNKHVAAALDKYLPKFQLTHPVDGEARTTLQSFEVQNYKRLMALETRGIEEYHKMRKEPALTPEAVVSFINQLSRWNLATTGIYILKAYTDHATLNQEKQKGGEDE